MVHDFFASHLDMSGGEDSELRLSVLIARECDADHFVYHDAVANFQLDLGHFFTLSYSFNLGITKAGARMHFILESIESAARQGLCFPAVVTALIVPDIAGKVASPAQKSQERYVNWVNSHFLPKQSGYAEHGIDGVTLYALRCKLLHEGQSDPSSAPAAAKSPAAANKRQIAFNVHRGLVVHLCTTQDTDGSSWTILHAEEFCRDIVNAAKEWMLTIEGDRTAMQRLDALVSIRMQVPRLVNGLPVFCAQV